MPFSLQVFNKPGVWPGFLGGMAVPLAIIVMMNLPPPLNHVDLDATFEQIASLFLTMPPLGALCSYGVANKRIRRQFMTGVTAPGFIIAAILLFNLTNKLRETKLSEHELAKNSAGQKEKLDEISEENKSRKKTVIPELLNGTNPL